MVGTAVVALGGNAIAVQGETGTYGQQRANADVMARFVSELLTDGWRVAVVHGNGPQVGNLAMQQEAGRAEVPPMPLYALDAMTQGQLGSLIGLALHRATEGRHPVAALVSHVVVAADDPAFRHPSKPIGPAFSRSEADRLSATRDWAMVQEAGRGHRRVVASPQPQRLLEIDAVRRLLETGHVVVAEGGGGVPVAQRDGDLDGVDAVIDKDYVAGLLARDLGAEALILVTEVDAVMVDFGSASPRRLGRIDVTEAERHLADGQFAAGSMRPKVAAAVRFVRDGGRVAVVTTATLAAATLRAADEAETTLGTRIVHGLDRESVA